MNILPQDIDYSRFAILPEIEYVRPAKDWEEEHIKYIEEGEEDYGDDLPWSKTHGKFKVRPGEVTVWAGVNGSKKSMILGMMAIWFPTEQNVLMCSMELKPLKTLVRMGRQASGVNQPSSEWIKRFYENTENLYMYDRQGHIDKNKILGMINWVAINRGGLNQVIIDSLMMVVSKTDDYNAQKEFVAELCLLAKAHNCHIHVVHHCAKGKVEGERIGKFQVKGAGEIIDLADNCIIIAPDVKKEKARLAHQPFNPEDPDIYMQWEKQRDGEFKGDIGFWFDSKSLRLQDYEKTRMYWRI